MPFLREIEVKGLFGLYDHEIDVHLKPPLTLIAGPNGVGKTTLLALTHALLSANYPALARHSFSELRVASTSGEELRVAPHELGPQEELAPHRYSLTLRRPGRSPLEAEIDVPHPLADIPGIPPWIRPLPATDVYEDTQTGEIVSREDLLRRYFPRGIRAAHRIGAVPQPPDWFRREDWSTDFIETKRLDSLLARARVHGREAPTVTPIDIYLEAVRDAMRFARGESTRIAQQRDRTFARRFIEQAAAKTVNEGLLKARYGRIETEAAELARNGLLTDSLEVLPTSHLTPTLKRVLSFFLDDFEAKLVPLQPLSVRLSQLRAIVQAKFLNKTVEIEPDVGLVFFAGPDAQRLDADALSSGEQHEIALISRLLFSVGAGTTVLIDEPELSLHVSWQHRMLDDLAAIAEIADLSFVLATHSTAIINNRWELVQELGPIDDQRIPSETPPA